MPDSWRLLSGAGSVPGVDRAPGVAPGATNMAVDAALLESVRRGAPPALRLYRWSPACLSFGRNQPARDLYDLDGAARRGIGFVRRPTGGQAVLHADELTYAVVAPVARIGRPRAAYRKINEALVAGLGRLGLQASVAGSAVPGTGGARTHDWARACFRTPEAGEVVIQGRKLVGSAQRTEGRVILQHGSLLVGGTQAVAEELLLGAPAPTGKAVRGGTPPALPDGWTTLEAELGAPPDPTELARALVAGFSEVVGITLAASSLTPVEAAAVARLRGQFASDAWTWRR